MYVDDRESIEVKKYINEKKNFNKVNFNNVKVLTESIEEDKNKIIEKIISVAVNSIVSNWDVCDLTLKIEITIYIKLLYVTYNDSKIYVSNRKIYSYDEIYVGNKVQGVDINILKSKNMIKVGSSIQDCIVLNLYKNIIQITIVFINWIEINEFFSLVLFKFSRDYGGYIYQCDEELKKIRQVAFLEEESIRNVCFSKKGDEIFFLRFREDQVYGIGRFNTLENKFEVLNSNMNIYNYVVMSNEEIVYLERCDKGTNVKLINIVTLQEKNILENFKIDIEHICCNKNLICISVKEDLESKIIIFNKEGTKIKTIVAEYSNLILLEESDIVIGNNKNCIDIIYIKKMKKEVVILDNYTVLNFKLVTKDLLIVNGICNNENTLIYINIYTLKKEKIFKTKYEINKYFFIHNNRLVVCNKFKTKWVLNFIYKGVIDAKTEIEENDIDLIIREE